ncbi:TonB-dependent receptor [Campylobacter curvus]|uniref:TonB-dependent receptor n=1 Tax=Campylobacter curvus (strain 525.92) TaxID=360105 RepID=A7GXS9_CAMC5|nr:TonB-dependent receptor [Campylobacter curvus]EAU00673.1 TonB-dependent receptor [Campylobacter curvus 525.92]
MKTGYFLSVAACLMLAQGLSATEKVTLEGVEVNSVGDNISESGVGEGMLNKNVQNGLFAGTKVQDVPYQINTITKEMMSNQGALGVEDTAKFFPSMNIQGDGALGRNQTRGFAGGIVGNHFWDGFYVASTTAMPMIMFESLQVQSGLIGSLYGGQAPSGNFSYTLKHPVNSQHAIWADYASRANFGIGLDSSDKFEYIGYRGVFYTSDGAKQAKDSNLQRRLASMVLEFYPSESVTIETAGSYYEHHMRGFAGGIALPIDGATGKAKWRLPDPLDSKTPGLGQKFAGVNLFSKNLSLKLKYAPSDRWYFEGGFGLHRNDRDIFRVTNIITGNNGEYSQKHDGGMPNTAIYRVDIKSAFAKATTNFDTFGLNHDLGVQANGYKTTYSAYNKSSTSATIATGNINSPIVVNSSSAKKGGGGLHKTQIIDMRNIAVLDNIRINDKFSLILSLSNVWFDNTSVATSGAKKKNVDKSGLSHGASLVYRPTQNLSLYLTYADSLQQPAYNSVTNTTLDPYRSKQYEFGVKGRFDELDVSAAIFDMKRPIAYLRNGSFSVQGEQRNRGLELTAGGKLVQNLSLFGGITMMNNKLKHAQLAAAEGKNVIGVPKTQVNLLFDYVVPNTDKLAFSTNFHYESGMYIDDANTQKTPSFFTTDIGVRYVSKALLGKQTTLRFNINNLFNEKYYYAMMFSNDSIANRNNTFHLGESRTFMLSAEVKF